MIHEERTYRLLVNKGNLVSYQVKIEQSDLFISSDTNLFSHAEHSLQQHRFFLENYIRRHPKFQTSLLPVPKDDTAPPIVRNMIDKSRFCGVGPMAAVAGAIAEYVGCDLLKLSENCIIENGGDIFLHSKNRLIVSVYAGESTLSYKVNLIVKPEDTPLGICTSSATVGPSLSFGKADAVCVISQSATLADAAASAIGNRVKSKSDIRKALKFGMTIPDIKGIIIILGPEMGAIGDIELTR